MSENEKNFDAYMNRRVFLKSVAATGAMATMVAANPAVASQETKKCNGGWDEEERKRVKKLGEKKYQVMKEAKTAEEMIKSWGKAFKGDEGDPMHNEYAETSIFAKRIPDLIVDYGHNPHLHFRERLNIHPKIKSLLHMAVYFINGHYSAVPHWAISAKKWGATDEEILETAAVAVVANAKSKMVDTDRVMTELFNSADYKNAEDITT